MQKRGGAWRVVLELGEQAAVRCPTCTTVRRVTRKDGTAYEYQRGAVYWMDEDPPDTCPKCEGELETIVSRRQELMPAKYATKKEADKALRDTLHDREHGDYIPPVDMTLSDWLTRWQTALEAENLAAGSLRLYKLHAGRIAGHIGHVPLQKLTRADVGVLAAKLNTEPGPHGHVLSPASRRSVLGVLHHALGDAVKDGLLRTNPATGVSRPTVHQREMHVWSLKELNTFLQATRDDRLGPLWHMLALTGLRRGEVLSLRVERRGPRTRPYRPAAPAHVQRLRGRRDRHQDRRRPSRRPRPRNDRRAAAAECAAARRRRHLG